MDTRKRGISPQRPTSKAPGEGGSALWAVMSPILAPPSSSPETRRKLFIGIAIAIAVVVVSAIVAVIQMGGRKHRRQERYFCETEDCMQHSALLMASLDPNVEPCANFTAHVCGNGVAESLLTNLLEPKLDAVLRDFNWTAARHLPSSAVSKALRFYDSCVERNVSSSNKSVSAFVRFIRNIHITWPDPPPNDLHPLDVLLGLVIRWGVHLWITAEFVRTSRQRRPVLFITGGRSSAFLRGTLDTNQYGSYVEQYCLLLGRQDSCKINATQLRRDEQLVWTIFSKYTAEKQAVFPLGEMENITPTISSSTWIDLLNKHFKLPSSPFNADSVAMVKHVDALTAIEYVFKELSWEQIMTHIGWTFIQLYSWLAIPEAIVLRFDSQADATEKAPAECFELVEDSMGLLLHIHQLQTTFRANDREKVDHLLDAISEAVMNSLNASEWIGEQAAITSIRRVNSTRHDVWPSEKMFSIHEFDKLYAAFPYMTDDFFSNWVQTREALRSVQDHPDYNDVFTKRYYSLYGPFSYHDYLNTVEVSVSALQSPLYYKEGILAMNYAGLGSRYSIEFLKTLYVTRVGMEEINDTRSRLEWLFVPVGNETTFQKRDAPSCVLLEDMDGVFPYGAALQVAYGAYETKERLLPNRSDYGVRIRALRKYTADQIFFLSFCLALCTFGKMCNVALSNFAPFVQAFGCIPGSGMNPNQKCTFFPSSS